MDTAVEFKIQLQIGITGEQVELEPTRISGLSIGAISSWAGSCHILSMGEHFHDYITRDFLPLLPNASSSGVTHLCSPLTSKLRSGSVTGNIGEGCAALLARRRLGLFPSDILHIKPKMCFSTYKCPDYVMRIGRSFPAPFSKVVEGIECANVPEWWPVESKARNSKASKKRSHNDAFEQIKSYWWMISNVAPSALGFGLITTLTYGETRTIHLSILLPKDQAKLEACFQQRKIEEVDTAKVKEQIHGE